MDASLAAKFVWKIQPCVKEKLERAKEGEHHHVLDHEEEHWMKLSGIQIQHVSFKKQALNWEKVVPQDPDQIAHLPPGEHLNIAVSLPFLDK